MLNTIKTMIQEKSSFLEAAEVIFEDGANLNLDDQIILGLESTNDVPMDGGSEELSPVAEDVDETENIEDTDDHEENKSDEEDDSPETKDDDDTKEEENVLDSDIDDGSTENDVDNNPDDNDDIMDAEIDDTSTPTTDGDGELSLPGNDLPGSQDDVNGDDNILNAEIDLGSNTIKDILPVPPANAGDVVPGADDTASQHVDSGFSNENPIDQGSEVISSEEEPVIEESATNKKDDDKTKEEDDEKIEESFWDNYFKSSSNTKMYSEAITIGDEEPEAAPSTDEKPSEEKPAEDQTTEETPAEEPAEENQPNEESPVTAAIKDKVAEMNTEEPNQKENQQDLLKKLGNITKSLEDAKKAVMNSIQ